MRNPTDEQIDNHIQDAAMYVDGNCKGDAYFWHGKTVDGLLITSNTFKWKEAALVDFNDKVAAHLEMFP